MKATRAAAALCFSVVPLSALLQVDAEHKRNVQSHMRRKYQLSKHLAADEHQYNVPSHILFSLSS